MSNDNTTSRETLLKTVNLLRPALATQNYIPALMHIRFAENYATAYNDVTAIMVRCEAMEDDICLPGDLLIRALQSFKGESLLMQAGKDSSIQLVSGRSKVKLPSLPAADFPFELPDGKAAIIAFDNAILKGIERCLTGVGKDSTHPAQLGVTLDTEDGVAVLYSTDNYTISRYRTATKLKLPGDAPIILPTFFAEQLLSLGKVFSDEDIDLHVLPGVVIAKLGNKARLVTKTLVDVEPLDFAAVLSRCVDLNEVERIVEVIPDAFEGAFERALLVMSSEVDKVTKVTAARDGLRLHTSSALGDADDTLPFPAAQEMLDTPVNVDPAMVLRGSKGCAKLCFMTKGLLLTDADAKYLHLISYVSA